MINYIYILDDNLTINSSTLYTKKFNGLQDIGAAKINGYLKNDMEKLNQEGNVRDEVQSENDSMVDSSNESSSSNEIPLIGCENISRFL